MRPTLPDRLRAAAVYARHEGRGETAKLMDEAADALSDLKLTVMEAKLDASILDVTEEPL